MPIYQRQYIKPTTAYYFKKMEKNIIDKSKPKLNET